MKKNNLLLIGNIGKSKGLNGEFFLNSYTSPYDNIISYKDDLIFKKYNLSIEYIKKSNNKLVAKIKSIDNIDGIKEIVNTKIYIKKNLLPIPKENEFYLYEFEGMSVFSQSKMDMLGIVKEIQNYGSDDCLVVVPSNESIDNKTRLIPIIFDRFITRIDNKNKTIIIDWEKDF